MAANILALLAIPISVISGRTLREVDELCKSFICFPFSGKLRAVNVVSTVRSFGTCRDWDEEKVPSKTNRL